MLAPRDLRVLAPRDLQAGGLGGGEGSAQIVVLAATGESLQSATHHGSLEMERDQASELREEIPEGLGDLAGLSSLFRPVENRS